MVGLDCGAWHEPGPFYKGRRVPLQQRHLHHSLLILATDIDTIAMTRSKSLFRDESHVPPCDFWSFTVAIFE